MRVPHIKQDICLIDYVVVHAFTAPVPIAVALTALLSLSLPLFASLRSAARSGCHLWQHQLEERLTLLAWLAWRPAAAALEDEKEHALQQSGGGGAAGGLIRGSTGSTGAGPMEVDRTAGSTPATGPSLDAGTGATAGAGAGSSGPAPSLPLVASKLLQAGLAMITSRAVDHPPSLTTGALRYVLLPLLQQAPQKCVLRWYIDNLRDILGLLAADFDPLLDVAPLASLARRAAAYQLMAAMYQVCVCSCDLAGFHMLHTLRWSCSVVLHETYRACLLVFMLQLHTLLALIA